MPYFQACDTCDSKNTKTPVTRAYAYAREGVIICIFTFPQTQFLISVSPIVFYASHRALKTSRHFPQNDTLFAQKQAVVFIKTTRHFLGHNA